MNRAQSFLRLTFALLVT